jgi:hypothetical protein
MYKWIRGIVVIEQRVDKYKYIKKKERSEFLERKPWEGKKKRKEEK